LGRFLYTFGTERKKSGICSRSSAAKSCGVNAFRTIFWSDSGIPKNTAERRGDHWVINGQKIWTTDGHLATCFICLVRRPILRQKPQKGIPSLWSIRKQGLDRPIISSMVLIA